MAGKRLLQLDPRNIRELRTVQCTPPSHAKVMLKFVPKTPDYGCCSATVLKKGRVTFHTDDAPQGNMQPRGNKLQATLSDSFRRIKFLLPQINVSGSQTEELHVKIWGRLRTDVEKERRTPRGSKVSNFTSFPYHLLPSHKCIRQRRKKDTAVIVIKVVQECSTVLPP